MTTDQIIKRHLDDNYKIDIILEHNDILPFVRENLKPSNLITLLFYFITISGFIILLGVVISQSLTLGIFHAIISLILGIVSTIFLIPIHEGVHAIAYKICGAKSIQFGVNWKQLYFTASAHHYLAGYKELFFVGLSPFLAINIAGLFLLFAVSHQYSIGLLSCLAFHNVMCAGDFGILSYFFQNRKSSPLTFDDVSEARSFFLIKE